MSRAWTFAFVAIALVAIPDVALACPACFDGPGETRQAFLATTAFLTLLPLGIVGATTTWLRSRARQSEAEHEPGSDAGPDSTDLAAPLPT